MYIQTYIKSTITSNIVGVYHKNVYKPIKDKKNMNKWAELVVGLLFVILPIIVAWYSHVQAWSWDFWTAAGMFFQGGLFWFLILIGVLFIVLGISDLKESSK
jgi:RsiW-degrading membrane proteinase PrsW (M82 family)